MDIFQIFSSLFLRERVVEQKEKRIISPQPTETKDKTHLRSQRTTTTTTNRSRAHDVHAFVFRALNISPPNVYHGVFFFEEKE